MFWEKSYSQSQNIENLLQREDVTVEELLHDEDILQECKLQTRRLMQFLTRPGVIKQLIVLAVTEPAENMSVAERFKYSNIACEILTSGLPSLDEKLVEDTEILQTLYSFLENEPPLNPLLAAFFSKTFSMLISKKHEQDWFLYQKMCLQLLEFIKSRGNFLDLMLKHFGTPVIMDLLLQIVKEVQGGTLKKNLYEWLTEQKLVERVISILGNPEEQDKHPNAAEFLIDLIKYGRSMRQSDQKDSLEQAFTGSDPLLQALEDDKTITLLLDAILCKEPQESSIVAGILIVLTLVDEAIVEEPASDKALKKMIDNEKENYERVVLNVVNQIAPRIQEFHRLLLEPPKKYNFVSGSKCFGLTRLQVCRLFTVLLQTGNEKVVEAICQTDFFNTMLTLFKEYSGNNFLHSEVEKCFAFVFKSAEELDVETKKEEKNDETCLSALQKHVIVNCKIISKLVDCWFYNTEIQSCENGRRLGYMGHLIQILKHVSSCVSKLDDVGALTETVLGEEEAAKWKSLIDSENGELKRELDMQNKLLADCDPKAFQNDNLICEHDINVEVNISDGMDDPSSPFSDSAMSKLYEYLENENVISCILSHCDEMTANLERQLKVWGNDMNENSESDVRLDGFTVEPSKTEVNTLNMPINPWGAESFNEAGTSDTDLSGWADFSSNNFADFDSHFSLYKSDFGDRFDENQGSRRGQNVQMSAEKSDNNANVENPAEQVAIDGSSGENLSNLPIECAENDKNKCAESLESTVGIEYEDLQTNNANGENTKSLNDANETESCTKEAIRQEFSVVANGPSKQQSEGVALDLLNLKSNPDTSEAFESEAEAVKLNDVAAQATCQSNALSLLESENTSEKADKLCIVPEDETKAIL